MIELLDLVIKQALLNRVTFTTIVMDVRSFDRLHLELGQKDSILTGYKGYTLEFSYTDCFNSNFFKIELR